MEAPAKHVFLCHLIFWFFNLPWWLTNTSPPQFVLQFVTGLWRNSAHPMASWHITVIICQIFSKLWSGSSDIRSCLSGTRVEIHSFQIHWLFSFCISMIQEHLSDLLCLFNETVKRMLCISDKDIFPLPKKEIKKWQHEMQRFILIGVTQHAL